MALRPKPDSTLELLHADFDFLTEKYRPADPTPELMATIKEEAKAVLQKHFEDAHLISVHVVQEERSNNFKVSFLPLDI